MAGLPTALRKKKEALESTATLEQRNAVAGKPNLELVQGSVVDTPAVPMPEAKAIVQDSGKSEAFDESRFFVQDDKDSIPAQQESVNWRAEAERYKEEAKLNWDRWESYKGMYRKLEDESTLSKEKLTKFESELQELRTRAESKPPAPIVHAENLDLDEEELKAYAHALPTLEKIAKKKALEYSEPLRQEIIQLKEAQNGVSKNLTQAQKQSFISMVRTAVGNEHFDDITKGNLKNKWVDYLSQRAFPGTRATIGQFLDTADKESDLDSVVDIFNSFKSSVKSELPSTNALASMMSPTLGAVGSTGVKQKSKLKFSLLKEANIKRLKGHISQEEYQKIRTMYQEAEREGRIDTNA